MNKKDILILSQTDKEDYALREWEKNGIKTGITFQEQPKWLRAIRRIWMKCGFPMQSIWYGAWKRDFLKYKYIILHGNWLVEDIPHWMQQQAQKNEKNLKIIWWYWNKVDPLSNPDKVLEADCEKWSFDLNDCETFGMKHNTQYYFKTFQLPDISLEHDIYFLGSDGGRKEALLGIEKKLNTLGLKTDFHILTAKAEGEEKSLITKKLSYTENLCHIAKNKAILEILREGQSGQTLRALEALFFQKKLITNDIRIKTYDYYHPDNIFILGEQDIETLPAFLNKEYVKMPNETIDKYDCFEWLKRFDLS